MKYTIIKQKEYNENKDYYITLINELFENDDNEIANTKEITTHLDFIFNKEYNLNSFLILQLEKNKLISMINGYEYNNILKEWCLFSLYTKKEYRKKGYAENILKQAITQTKKYNSKKIIVGIKKENIASIKLHEKVGFKYANCNWDQLEQGFPSNHLGYYYEIGDEKMEYLQLFNENKEMLNEKIDRELKKTLTGNKYFMIILLFIENDNKFLLQTTSKQKDSEIATTGGHVEYGYNGLQTTIKEAKEELGLELLPNELNNIDTIKYNNCFIEIYHTNKIIDTTKLKLQTEEVESVNWYTIEDINELINNNKLRKSNIEPFKKVLENRK